MMILINNHSWRKLKYEIWWGDGGFWHMAKSGTVGRNRSYFYRDATSPPDTTEWKVVVSRHATVEWER